MSGVILDSDSIAEPFRGTYGTWQSWQAKLVLASESCQHYITFFSKQVSDFLLHTVWYLFPPCHGSAFGVVYIRGSETRDPSPQATSSNQRNNFQTFPHRLLCSLARTALTNPKKQHYATRINTVFAVLHVDETNGIPSLSPRVLTPVTFMTPSDTGMMIREGSLSSFRLMKPHSLRHKHPEISRAILLHLQTKSPLFMSTRSSFWRCYQ